jgi:hypothetical protein
MQSLEDLIPHQLKLSKAQMTKLLQGLMTAIPHSNLGAEKGDAIIHLLGANADKLMKAYKTGTGAKIKLNKMELASTLKHGRGWEDVLNSPVAQKVINKLIDKGIDRLVGGDIWGQIGSVFQKIAENPTTQKVAEKLAEKAIDRALAGGAVKQKKGSAEMKARMAKLRSLKKGGSAESERQTYENLMKIQSGLRKIGTPFEATIGVNPADIGEPIGKAIGETFRKDLRGLFGLSGDGVKGMGVANSKAYRVAMKDRTGVSPSIPVVSNAPVSKFALDKRVRPSSDQMTLSPYQAPSAPAMNPFVPKHYTQEGGTQSGYGGRGLY